jgi:RHS repeat-associated protein
VNYDGSSTTTSIAAALYAAFPSNSLVTMSNPNGSSSFTLTTTATGSATNSASFTDALTSGCDPTSEYVACRGVGWTMTLSGPNLSPTTAASASLTGGSDNIDTTFYDTGTVTVNITIGGMGYSKTSTYGQSSTVAGIASDLANQINSDTTLNQKLVASSTSNVLNLTTTATGANTADPLSVTGGTSSQYFASGSSSFTATPSGSTLTPGQNGVVFDAGTVTVSIAGFTATPRNYTANYSQGSSASTVASAIAGAINGDSIAPVTANVTNGSNVVTLTSKTLGSDTNYGVTATSATSQGTYFTQASFSGSGTALSGGTDSTASLSTPLSTFYGYNALGNLLAVTQGQQIRRYQYDSLGRMTSACLPELSNQCTTYTYTDFGAMATKADPRSITTTYGYGTLGRLLTVTYSDGTPGVTYTYGAAGSGNGAGRLASVNTSSTADAYTYDNMGRVTQCVKTIAGQNYTTSYHYSNGQLDYLTYPSGRVVYQDHDAIGRLSQIRSSGLTLFSVGSFNAGGEILSSTYGNGMTGSYTYNNQMQLASLQTSNSGVAVLNLVYSYGGANDNGQISGITDGVNSARSTSYLYDELGRLKIAQTTDLTSANTWKLKFSYDRYGNRLSEVPVAGTASMPMNEMVADPATNRLTNLAYDADGNVTNDGLHAYAYNALNHITNVDGASNTYAYDARGLRVNKNGTVYIYSSGRPIAEYASGAAANSPKVEYGYFRGQLVASVASGVLTYYYGDHLSTRVQADGSGTVTRTFGLFPFGETWYETGTPNEWKFTTYERDSESGLDYAKARYDSIQLGRFTSLDLLAGNGGDPQSRNRYTYVTNDPINLSDPTGLNSSKWDMCVYDDKGDPAQCFALPGASKELTDAEALFGVFEMLSKLDCSAHCEIQIGPDTSLDFINALNLAAGFLPNLEIVQVGISDSARGVDNFWTCFAGLSCNPVEKFMQPIVSRDLGPLNIPSLPRPKAGVPPPETPVPNFGRRVDPLSGHQVDQLEPIPPELLVAPGISVRW